MRKLLLLSSLLLTAFCSAQTPKSRHFIFDYSFTVKVTDPGKPLDVWFPMAHSDQFQQVKVVEQKGDLPLKETSESEYGNKFFYAHTDKAALPEYHFTVKYTWSESSILPPLPSKRNLRRANWTAFFSLTSLCPSPANQLKSRESR